MSVPEHVRQAVTREKTAEVAGAIDKLHRCTLETALALIEGNFHDAARSAYRAAWYWQKLPANEQSSYVETELVDDAGPVDSGDEWSGAAFVAWLVYRCNRLATAYGREISALGERVEPLVVDVPHTVQDVSEAPKSYARPTFAGFADVAEKEVERERLQS